MFKVRDLSVTLPGHEELVVLDEARAQALRLDPSSSEGDEAYWNLITDLRLNNKGEHLMFDGGEHTCYCGQVDGTLVFAICIGDDEPTWLFDLFELSKDEVPIHGESVYVIAAGDQGQGATATLAVHCGASSEWNAEAPSPLDDEDLGLLVELVTASPRE